MENKIMITPEMIKNATTYMPLMKKHEVIASMLPLCIDKVNVSYQNAESGIDDPMPNRAQANNEMIAMNLMGLLASYYLKQPFDFSEKDNQMPANVYDQWAGSHVMNQLDRLKGNKEVGNKVYDLLYDFKDFKWTLLREIDALLAHQNDAVTRMAQLLGKMGQEQMTPEQLEEAVSKLKKLAEQKEASAEDAEQVTSNA